MTSSLPQNSLVTQGEASIPFTGLSYCSMCWEIATCHDFATYHASPIVAAPRHRSWPTTPGQGSISGTTQGVCKLLIAVQIVPSELSAHKPRPSPAHASSMVLAIEELDPDRRLGRYPWPGRWGAPRRAVLRCDRKGALRRWDRIIC